MQRRLTGILTLVVLLVGSAEAKNLYVNGSTGNDSVSYASNSESNPWRTVGRAAWGSTSRGSQNGAEGARAGDVVIVAAGTYDTSAASGQRYDPIYNPVNSGTSSAPITFKANGVVNLRSSTSTSSQPIIGTYNRSWIVWDGFRVDERYVPTARDTGPVVIWQSQNVTVQNVQITGFSRNWADNHNGIRIEYGNNITIRGNTISGYNESSAGMNGAAITLYHSQTVIIENNEISQATTGIFVKGLVDGPVTIRKNLVHDVDYGILFGGIGTAQASNGAKAYSNIIYNCWACVSFIGYDNVSPANVVVANNTLLYGDRNNQGEGGAVLFRPGYSGYRNIRVFNNMISNSRAGIVSWENQVSQVTLGYNAYYQNTLVGQIGSSRYTSLAQWQSTGKDSSGALSLNPLFVSLSALNLKVQSGSPLAGAGLDILDLNGNGSTTDRVNIGAYALGNEVIGPSGSTGAGGAVAITPNPPVLQSVQ